MPYDASLSVICQSPPLIAGSLHNILTVTYDAISLLLSRISDAIVREFQNVHLRGAESPMKHPDTDPPPPAAAESQGVTEPTTTTLNKPSVDGEGLIVPKKLNNPCIDSKEVQSLTKEIKWNKRT